MRKFIAVLVAGMLVSLSAVAETDYIAMPIIRDIQKGVNNNNQLTTLRVSGTATIGGAATITGAATVGSLSTAGKVTSYSRAAAVSPSTTAWAVDGGLKVWPHGAAVSVTQAFSTVFSAAPYVTLTYAADSGGVGITNHVVQTASPGTNFIITGVVTSFYWMASGPK